MIALIQINDRNWSLDSGGITVLERMLRTLSRCGIERALLWGDAVDGLPQQVREPRWPRSRMPVETRNAHQETITTADLRRFVHSEACLSDQEFLLFTVPAIYDQRLVKALIAHPGPAVLVDSNPAGFSTHGFCGVVRLDANRLPSTVASLADWARNAVPGRLDVAALDDYLPDMRRQLRPYWYAPVTADLLPQIRATLLDGVQKKSLDLPAAVHAPIEQFLVRRVSRLPVTPNQLTLAGNLIAYGATWLFASGALWAGLLVALFVSVLDGVDGKLARLKLEQTPLGRLEHHFDYLFELSWWVALAWYLHSSGLLGNAFGYFMVLFVADWTAMTSKLVARRATGRSLDDFSTITRFLRGITGRRNIYLWILAVGILTAGAPTAFKAICIWAAVSAVAYLLTSVTAIFWMRRSATVG